MRKTLIETLEKAKRSENLATLKNNLKQNEELLRNVSEDVNKIEEQLYVINNKIAFLKSIDGTINDKKIIRDTLEKKIKTLSELKSSSNINSKKLKKIAKLPQLEVELKNTNEELMPLFKLRSKKRSDRKFMSGLINLSKDLNNGLKDSLIKQSELKKINADLKNKIEKSTPSEKNKKKPLNAFHLSR